MKLETLIGAIGPEDGQARAQAHEKWCACAKPLGGLGLLETAVEDMAALTGSPEVRIDRRAVVVLGADNGVVAQGVTQAPSSVTTVVMHNLNRRCSPVCLMADTVNCQVVPVDMGVLDFPETPGILSRRMGNGTGDIAREPAMSRETCLRAILTGADLVRELKEQGIQLIATGEVGIGNTTTTAAVACVLLGRSPEELTGRGSGLSDQGLQRKIDVIAGAIARMKPDPKDPVDLLSKVGGYDLAGMCGLFLGGARYGVPVLIDGVISAAAALCAQRLCPAAGKAMLASHVTTEPASRLLLKELGREPLITAGFHLGEGTGAVAAIPLLDMALAVYHRGCRFDQCGVEAYRPLGGELC